MTSRILTRDQNSEAKPHTITTHIMMTFVPCWVHWDHSIPFIAIIRSSLSIRGSYDATFTTISLFLVARDGRKWSGERRSCRKWPCWQWRRWIRSDQMIHFVSLVDCRHICALWSQRTHVLVVENGARISLWERRRCVFACVEATWDTYHDLRGRRAENEEKSSASHKDSVLTT